MPPCSLTSVSHTQNEEQRTKKRRKGNGEMRDAMCVNEGGAKKKTRQEKLTKVPLTLLPLKMWSDKSAFSLFIFALETAFLATVRQFEGPKKKK